MAECSDAGRAFSSEESAYPNTHRIKVYDKSIDYRTSVGALRPFIASEIVVAPQIRAAQARIRKFPVDS